MAMSALRNRPSLLICIVLDVVGYVTYLLPGLAEWVDVVWAPISGWIFYRMFGGKKGVIGGIINFIEEILPGLDFIPSFTIMWIIQFFRQQKQVQSIPPI